MTRFVAAVLAAATLLSISAPNSKAMTPAQGSEWGLVNLLGYNLTTGGLAPAGSIDAFWRMTMASWGRAYATPWIKFYNGQYGNYSTGCVHTSTHPNNGFYCPTDGKIYLDYPFQDANLRRYGDYYSGNFLAHEWGHRIQHYLGALNYGIGTEYHADCLAGMYTRWGYMVGRLNGSDYGEGYNWLYYQPIGSPTHGSGPTRAEWYRYGYTQYSLAACNQALSATTRTQSTVARTFVPARSAAVDLTPDGGRALPADDSTPPSRIGGAVRLDRPVS